MADKGYMGLPRITPERFNELSTEYFPTNRITWTADKNKNGIIDVDEITADGDIDTYIDKKPFFGGCNDTDKFTWLFYERYRLIIEAGRREAVEKHLNKTKVQSLTTNFADLNLPDAEILMIKQILKVGTIMDDLFQMQVGSFKYRERIKREGTSDDIEMMERYQKPWCFVNPDPLCSAFKAFDPWVTGMYPEGTRPEDLKGNLETPFSVVVKEKSGALKAVSYAESGLGPKVTEASRELVKAADLAENAGETLLADYMRKVAKALLSDKPYPYGEADKAWMDMKGKTKYYLRVGPDETTWDELGVKSGLQMRFGIIDFEAAKSVEMYSGIRQKMEDAFAALIGPPYKARQVSVELPDFVNLVVENGESRGYSVGTSMAQTLPNWCGDDGKAPCPSRTMSFNNKLANFYSPDMLRAYKSVMHPNTLNYFDHNYASRVVVDHEFAHNLGPSQGLPVGGRKLEDYFEELRGVLEECKAQAGAMFLNGWFGENGLRNADDVKKYYTANLLWMLGFLRRVAPFYKEGKLDEVKERYQLLCVVQFGYLIEKGAITFDEKTGTFEIHFDKIDDVYANFLKEWGQLYIKHDKSAAKAFIERYTKERADTLHLDRVAEALTGVPGTLYEYKFEGLD